MPPEELKEVHLGPPAQRSALLAALYTAQEQHGYLSEEALRRTAEKVNVPLADVYATASFYSLFHTQPVGRYVIQVCEGLSCYLVGGAERLVDYIQQRLGIEVGETTPDGLFTLQTVECLASCGTSPTLRINDELHEDVTPEKIDRLLTELAGR
jgi:NADH-quinone oxidoreductase subunit E